MRCMVSMLLGTDSRILQQDRFLQMPRYHMIMDSSCLGWQGDLCSGDCRWEVPRVSGHQLHDPCDCGPEGGKVTL